MLTPLTAFPILADVIRHNRTHRDYKTVCEHKALNYKLITGDGVKDLVPGLARREKPEEKEQRLTITQITVISWVAAWMQPFYKPGRLRNIKRSIGYREGMTGTDKKVQEVEEGINTYWGKDSLDKYVAIRLPKLSWLDPNAFVVTEFGAFNPNIEKARPYPVEFSCEECVDFRYTNNVLDYLTVKQFVNAIDRTGKLVEVARYTMYLENDIVQVTELPDAPIGVLESYNFESNELPQNGFWYPSIGKGYRVELYQPKGGRVQAVRTGYLTDGRTNDRTCVSPLHVATPILLKAIKEISEMDLTLTFHAFPQKLFYAEPCPGENKSTPCLGGMVEGTRSATPRKCQKCEGTGVVVHKSGSDAIAVPMPRKGEKVEVKLDDYIVYKAPPVELLEFMNSHIQQLRGEGTLAIYNSGGEQAIQVNLGEAKSATEVSIDSDKEDNTLQPFTEHASSFWKYKATLIATFKDDYDGLELVHEYPETFTPKTYERLLEQRKAAVDAGAPHYIIQELDKEMSEMLFSDDPGTLTKIRTRNYYTPWAGKTTEEVQLILTGKHRNQDRILWQYVDTIFDELEADNKNFYLMTREKQWPLIQAKIAEIAAQEDAETVSAFGVSMELGDGPMTGSGSAQEKLRYSVGAAGIISAIQLAIAKKITTLEAGVNQLVIQMGYTEEEARKLLGEVPLDLEEQVKDGTVTA